MRFFAYFGFTVLSAVSVWAQTASGPLLGWSLLPDGRTASAINGVPGARSWLGHAVSLPGGVQRVQIGPSSNVAFAVETRGGAPVILDLSAMSRTVLAKALPYPDEAAWSPTGSALGLLYKSAELVQIFTRQSGSYQYLGQVSAALNRAAVSDDGVAVLGAGSAGLSLYQAGNASVLSADPNASFTVVANSHTPAFWSAGQLTIGGQNVAVAAVSGEAIYLASPGANRVLAVHAASGNITSFDSTARQMAEAAGHGAVASLGFVGQTSTLQLNTTTGGPLWLAESGAATRIFFVPGNQVKTIPVGVKKGH